VKSISQTSALSAGRATARKNYRQRVRQCARYGRFTLSDGRKIEISRTPEKDAKFLNAARKAACGRSRLCSPGSDPDHSLHFHLDLEPRRNGGTFCQ